MNDFLSISACHGHRPKQLGISNHRSRAEQLAKMVRQRSAVRFLVAPSAFGKTALAAEYAESIFSFENVFWLNGTSPCFLRDLDRDIMVATLTGKGSGPSLVVFEDVPLLDDTRADLLSNCFDEFLAQGWEVVATMTPACDVFGLRQPDGIRLRARDLLLADSEIDAERTEIECLRKPASSFTDVERIPGLFWGEDDAHKKLLHSIAKEDIPNDTLLAVFAMAVLQRGSLGDLMPFMKGWTPRLQEELQESYLFLGVDVYAGTFSAVPFPVKTIAGVFLSRLDILAACSELPDKNVLVCRLADTLCGTGELERACLLVRLMCTTSTRVPWLSSRQGLLTQESCFLPAHLVFESFQVPDSRQGKGLSTADALWRLALGDTAGALNAATRICSSSHADKASRALASLMMLEYGSPAQTKKAREHLDAVLRFASRDAGHWCSGEAIREHADGPFSWRLLAIGRLLPSLEDARRFIDACFDEGIKDGAVSILVWLYFAKGLANEPAERPQGPEAMHRAAFAQRACDHIEARNRRGELGFFDFLAIGAMEKACSCDGIEGELYISPSITGMAHDASVKLFSQRAAYSRLAREQSVQKRAYLRTHPDEFRPDGYDPLENGYGINPRLHVSLFGGLEARVGDRPVDDRLFRRQSVKTLLALLTINLGKEISRDRLCEIIWPDSSPEAAVRSFYSTWSLLRKALQTPGGGCPYLVRLHHSCKLDSRLATSDVSAFDLACRKLHFDQPNAREWSKVFTEINDLYVGDILPSDTKNNYITQMRLDYKNRLVDAFATAARRLFDIREYQAALWFAHTAVEHDKTREDAYAVLMQAQVAVGQRTAALETYFNCRRYLANELGIDPSTRTVLLYNEIIAEDPGLQFFKVSE